MKSIAKIFTATFVSILVLSLIMVSAASLILAGPGGTSWTKYTGQLSMQNQPLVADSWVIKDGATYKMWFTRILKNADTATILSRINDLDPNLDTFTNNLFAKNYDALFAQVSGYNAADVVALKNSATTVIGYATSNDGITWTIQNNNVLSGGNDILTGVGTPTVVNVGGTYHMWYTKGETDMTQASLATVLTQCGGNQANRKTAVETVLQGTRTVIGHAISNDGGLTWTQQNNQVFPTSDGNLGASVGAPCVIYDADDATYKMWYTRPQSDLTESQWADVMSDTANINLNTAIAAADGTSSVVGFATSPDGLNWTVQDPAVFAGDGTLWRSVGDPMVIKSGGTYHMWYTRANTNLLRDGVRTVWDQLAAFNLADIFTALAADDLMGILNAVLALDLTTINNTLAATSTTIGYATSSNGSTWSVQNTNDIVGSTGSTWSSVAAPTVVTSGGTWEMWFTEGINELTLGKIVDLILGSDFPIGRAVITPTPPLPPAPPPVEEEPTEEGPGITPLTGIVDEEGQFTVEVTASSEDSRTWVTIPEGTTGLTAEGEPLTSITVEEVTLPPPPPEDNAVIALTYNFGPEGATFDEPVSITIQYSESDIPAGIAEEDLTIAVWDDLTGQWVKLDTVVDTVNNTATAQVTHFSTFTVLAPNLPASFQISKLSVSPDEVEIGEHIDITVFVVNTGNISGNYKLELLINDEVVQTKEVVLGGQESVTVTFNYTPDTAGVFPVSINGLTGRFTVNAPPVVELPEPADIVTSNLSVTPADVKTGETVTIRVQVANRGGEEGTYTVELKIDGVIVETRQVTLAAEESQTLTFTTSEDSAGMYLVNVDDLSASFTVTKPVIEEEPAGTNWGLIGGIIGGVVVIAAVAIMVIIRRRRL